MTCYETRMRSRLHRATQVHQEIDLERLALSRATCKGDLAGERDSKLKLAVLARILDDMLTP